LREEKWRKAKEHKRREKRAVRQEKVNQKSGFYQLVVDEKVRDYASQLSLYEKERKT